MQIKKQKKSNKKPLIIVIIVLLLIAIGGVCAYLYLSNKPNNGQNQSNTEKSESKKSDNTDDSKTKSSDTNTESSDKKSDKSDTNNESVDGNANKTPVKYENYTPPANNELSGTVNYAAAVDDTLVIRTTINQLVHNGTCKLTMSGPRGQSYSNESNIVANPSTSSCSGFNIPLGQLAASASARSGTWKINISINAEDKTGSLTSEVKL